MYGPGLLVALLTPFLAVIGLGVLVPLLSAAVDSLVGGSRFGDAYLALLDDRTFWIVLVRTLSVAAIVSAVSTVVAYPTAVFIRNASPRVRPILLALIVIPLLSSTVGRTYGWIGIFIRGGLVDQVASLFGFGPLHLLYTDVSVSAGMIGVLLPYATLPIYAALLHYDDRLSLASQSLGAGGLRTLVMVKLPVLAPSIIGGATLVFVLALGFFITPALLGGPGNQLVSNMISQQIFGRYDFPRGEAMGAILIVAALLTLGLAGAGMRFYARSRR